MEAFGASDIGKNRQLNEDSYYLSKSEDAVHIFIVADGMGGYNGGEIASNLAVTSARNYILSNFEKAKEDRTSLLNLVTSSTQYANMVVYEKARETARIRKYGYYFRGLFNI